MPNDAMMIVLVVILIVIVIYFLFVYNGLTKLKNLVEEAFSTMDVYLKKRWDLIPNIVETVKGYAEHEKKTLEEVVVARGGNYESLNSRDKVDLNKKLSPNISRLMALAESYPELKASENFINLSKELSKVEEDIANARKYYNGTVRKMNDKVQMFPSNIVAKIMGFKVYPMFEIDAEARENIKVEI